jgi:hypothetical protein
MTDDIDPIHLIQAAALLMLQDGSSYLEIQARVHDIVVETINIAARSVLVLSDLDPLTDSLH